MLTNKIFNKNQTLIKNKTPVDCSNSAVLHHDVSQQGLQGDPAVRERQEGGANFQDYAHHAHPEAGQALHRAPVARVHPAEELQRAGAPHALSRNRHHHVFKVRNSMAC